VFLLLCLLYSVYSVYSVFIVPSGTLRKIYYIPSVTNNINILIILTISMLLCTDGI